MWLRAERLSETGVAFARASSAPTETAITFAGEKRLFLARISVAEVMVVSLVAVWGRALVMVVSRWSASVVAEVSLVSTSSRHRCLCAKKFALLGSVSGCARKSSPSARKIAQNRRFVVCWASFFAKTPLEGQCWASFFAG